MLSSQLLKISASLVPHSHFQTLIINSFKTLTPLHHKIPKSAAPIHPPPSSFHHHPPYLNNYSQSPINTTMSEDALRSSLAEKQSVVEAQGRLVRDLKASGKEKDEIDEAVKKLNELKLDKAAVEKELQVVVSSNGGGSGINRDVFRQAVVNTLERRLFYETGFKLSNG